MWRRTIALSCSLIPPSAASARSTHSNGSCCVRARSNRCCWSLRICTGLMPRLRHYWTVWWGACQRRPATVQAVLAARIDRLPPEEKTLLQTAAAIGTEVPVLLLQAIAELPEAALHRALAHLQAAEFLYETRLFPEQVCTFKHALTHEVAYSSLLHERRRVLHARIAETLEEIAGDRVAEQ